MYIPWNVLNLNHPQTAFTGLHIVHTKQIICILITPPFFHKHKLIH